MYCPECGNDAKDAKFCPECGANLAGVQDALKGKAGAAQATQSGAAQATQSDVAQDAAAASGASAGGPGRLSPAVIWGGFGALALIVIVIVVMVSGGFGGSAAETTVDASTAPVAAVEADTSGSYEELVQRANDLYDKGDAAFQNQDFEQGGQLFAAAAQIYGAAWKKQATDPSVGTDYSVTLFYSGDIDGALKQIDAVLQADPDFQKAWLNQGIFLSHEARIAEQAGDTELAEKYDTQARQALTKAVAIDPKSDAGKQADQSLQAMEQ
jgi:tetratricopeptide (TPR) repeat protein